MSLWTRIKALLGIKASRALDRAEDPREMLDYSYNRQVELLQDVRRGLAEVATAKKRIELQAGEMGSRYDRLEAQAREAVRQGRDDLARVALGRRAALEGQVTMLHEQHDGLQAQETHLIENQQRLAARIEAFRTEKEAMKATYTASEAQARANEAAAGISGEMAEVGQTLERARGRVAQMRARAMATDELLASGALEDRTGAPDSDLDRQLGAGFRDLEVDHQLATIKKDLLGSGEEPAAKALPK